MGGGNILLLNDMQGLAGRGADHAALGSCRSGFSANYNLPFRPVDFQAGGERLSGVDSLEELQNYSIIFPYAAAS